MRRSLLLFFGALISCAAVVASGQTPQVQALSVHDVWESVVAAKGGHDRLRAIRSFVVSSGGKIDSSRPDIAPKLDIEEGTLLSHGYWVWADFRPGSFSRSMQIQSFAAHRFWMLWDNHSPDNRITTPDGEEWGEHQVIEEWELSYFLETSDVTPEVVSVSAPKDGQVVLELRTDRFASAKYTIDLKTYLPTSVTLVHLLRSGGMRPEPEHMWTKLEFDGVINISGIQLPRRVKRGSAWREPMYLVNPNIDPGMFNGPPDSTVQGAWRKWLRPDGAKLAMNTYRRR